MAYRMAGVREPRREINIAEPYDPFAYKELHHLEGLQLAPKGQAPQLLADGVFDRDGDLPVTPSGGLLGSATRSRRRHHEGLRAVLAAPRRSRSAPSARQTGTGVAQAWGDLMQVGTVVVVGKDGTALMRRFKLQVVKSFKAAH